MIVITKFDMFPNNNHYLSNHAVYEYTTQTCEFKHVWFTCINLYKWCYFLKYPAEDGSYDLTKVIGDDEIFKRAYKHIESYSLSSDQKTEYQLSMIKQNEADRLHGDGEIEGKNEEEARIKNIAARMLKRKNYFINEIAELTGLSKDYVLQLKKNQEI